jgi:hypothetical protein
VWSSSEARLCGVADLAGEGCLPLLPLLLLMERVLRSLRAEAEELLEEGAAEWEGGGGTEVGFAREERRGGDDARIMVYFGIARQSSTFDKPKAMFFE